MPRMKPMAKRHKEQYEELLRKDYEPYEIMPELGITVMRKVIGDSVESIKINKRGDTTKTIRTLNF